MTPSDLRTGLADALVTIPGLSVSAYRPNVIQPPHAVVSLASGSYDSVMARGADDLSLQVLIFVTRADDADGLALLDEYIAGHGVKSIKTILEDTDLTGLTTAMVRVRGYEIGTTSTPDGSEFLAATFDVQAVVSGVS